jgi:hypothetical protein
MGLFPSLSDKFCQDWVDVEVTVIQKIGLKRREKADDLYSALF